jgi:hypothetical protein
LKLGDRILDITIRIQTPDLAVAVAVGAAAGGFAL